MLPAIPQQQPTALPHTDLKGSSSPLHIRKVLHLFFFDYNLDFSPSSDP
jgi:hypothetical protein